MIIWLDCVHFGTDSSKPLILTPMAEGITSIGQCKFLQHTTSIFNSSPLTQLRILDTFIATVVSDNVAS